MSRKLLLCILVTLSVIGLSVAFSYGEKYPERPVEIMVGYTAGSTFDLVARVVADLGSKYLGQPLVVVNKPGAGGSLTAAEVISSKPDGYKLVLASTFFFATTTKTQKVPFDPYHLVPLVNFIELKSGILVKGDSRWKTLNDLLEYGRQNPGKLKWAHVGRGLSNHLYGSLMFRKAGIKTIDVPYKGNPELITALLGGHVDALFASYGPVKDHVKVGRIRCLATMSDRRYSDPSDVPCVAELGFAELGSLLPLAGMYVHKDAPEEVKKVLSDTFRKTCASPEFKRGIEKLGEEPRFEEPEFTNQAIKKAEENFVPLLKELGLYVK